MTSIRIIDSARKWGYPDEEILRVYHGYAYEEPIVNSDTARMRVDYSADVSHMIEVGYEPDFPGAVIFHAMKCTPARQKRAEKHIWRKYNG